MSIKQTAATAVVSAFVTAVVTVTYMNPVGQPVNKAVALASQQVLSAAGCLDSAGRLTSDCPADVRKHASDARKQARRTFQTMVPELIHDAAGRASGTSAIAPFVPVAECAWTDPT